jgi:hypothetical protein
MPICCVQRVSQQDTPDCSGTSRLHRAQHKRSLRKTAVAEDVPQVIKTYASSSATPAVLKPHPTEPPRPLGPPDHTKTTPTINRTAPCLSPADPLTLYHANNTAQHMPMASSTTCETGDSYRRYCCKSPTWATWGTACSRAGVAEHISQECGNRGAVQLHSPSLKQHPAEPR